MNDVPCFDSGSVSGADVSNNVRNASDREYDERVWEGGTHG